MANPGEFDLSHQMVTQLGHHHLWQGELALADNSSSTTNGKHRLPPNRDLVVVSGYYGFDNLGDDAILEQLLFDLEKAVGLEHVVVLSNSPEATERAFSVKSANRWKLPAIAGLLKRSTLLVSGGGGLFQDSTSVKSVIYYSGIIALAKLVGARVAIYAQGVGPLKSQAGMTFAKLAFSQANGITVRDSNSQKLLSSWNLDGELSADPVWCLRPRELPASVCDALKAAKPGWKPIYDTGIAGKYNQTKVTPRLVGLSIRPSPMVTESFLNDLGEALATGLPENYIFVPLILQRDEDKALTDHLVKVLKDRGRSVVNLGSIIDREYQPLLPSQWLSLIGSLDMVVGMRFHALLMGVKCGVACLGLSYDPKVTYLLSHAKQPFLDLVNGAQEQLSVAHIVSLLEDSSKNLTLQSKFGSEWSKQSQELACKNFDLLDRILSD